MPAHEFWRQSRKNKGEVNFQKSLFSWEIEEIRGFFSMERGCFPAGFGA